MTVSLIKHPTVKCFIEDCLSPFILGFFAILVICWLRLKLTNDQPEDLIATFRDNRTGQIFLKRHGIQETFEDLLRPSKDLRNLSLVAPGSADFKKQYIRTRKRNYGSQKMKRKAEMHKGARTVGDSDNEDRYPADPIGAVWPWPRIEAEAPSKPTVWVVTPTYRSPRQYAELTRIAQALYPCRRFVRWLIVDDSIMSEKYPGHLSNLREFLEQFKVKFKVIKTEAKPDGQATMFNPKGVPARRTAIAYIRKHRLKGVVYFADDDNTYDSDIFRQMQSTKKISVWPTGAITEWTVSGPVVNKSGIVVDFFDAWTANRRFPMDFASFAVNTRLLFRNPNANIPWIQGYEETIFLSTLKVNKEEFQPMAANATEVLTWHTRTVLSLNPKSKERLQKALKRLPYWPRNVQKLVEKYKFLFEYDNPKEPPTSSPRKKYHNKNEGTPAIKPETQNDAREKTTETDGEEEKR